MASKESSTDPLKCSFCGKSQKQVIKLIAGPGVYICDECIELCVEIIEEEKVETLEATSETHLPLPKEINHALNEFVIGQSEAKKTLSVAVYNHYKRIYKDDEKNDDLEIQKSNVLILGPTGSGKTLLAQTLAKILQVPFAIADATTLTEAGYVGEDVENILLTLIQAADFDIKKAEKGIIYIDEIDKITRKSDNPSITRDVSGEGVQQALLKILEGTTAQVPPQGGRKHPQQEYLQIDTTNILFIVGGAFDGLDQIIGKRLGDNSIGFNTNLNNKDKVNESTIFDNVEPKDLRRYGLIPEFIGRLPVVTSVNELDKEALIKILVEPKNAITKQFKKIFELDDVELTFTDGALEAMAELALERKTGARGLRSIIEKLLLDEMFEAPSRKDIEKIIIDKENVIDDIQNNLEFKRHNLIQSSFVRNNLSYVVDNIEDKKGRLLKLVEKIKSAVIVYVGSRKSTKEITDFLIANNYSANYYHGGLTANTRKTRQESWTNNQCRIMVATNAFGMGIERITMLKNGISDLRDFFDNDKRWLSHYGFNFRYKRYFSWLSLTQSRQSHECLLARPCEKK